MKILAVLAGGVRGAEDGTAEILTRTGGNNATWYTDYDGTGGQTGVVALDGNGGAVVYVNQIVRVRVKNSSGAVVREWVDLEAAPAVEVISASFTGNNYASGAAGTSRPTTLQSALDKVLTSFGTYDWHVLLNGVRRPLTALAAMFSVYYVVTDTTYGATGDGTTDDAASIQAAVDAAAAAGGGTVYFPQGTYLIRTAINIGDNVDLRGTKGAVLTTDQASQTILNVGENTEIRGLTIETSVASTGSLIVVDERASIVDCIIGSNLANGSLIEQTAAGEVLSLVRCVLTMGSSPTANTYAVEGNMAGGVVHLHMCNIGAPFIGAWGRADGMVRASHLSVSACRIVLVGVAASPSLTVFEAADGGTLRAVGNRFTDIASSSFPTYAFQLVSTSSLSKFFEAGNVIGNNVSNNTGSQGHKSAKWATASKTGLQEVTATGGTLSDTVDANESRFLTVELTDGTATAIEWATAPLYAGEEFTVLVWNNSGGGSGNITIGQTAAIGDAGSAFTIGSTQFAIADFIAVWSPSGTLRWVQRGSVQTNV